MKQVPKTPGIVDCFCGAKARCIDYDYDHYRVYCDNNHVLTGKFITIHRAVCAWNNKVALALDAMNALSPELAKLSEE